ncbi:MAG TPA: DNA replication and repair protein RecF [bacterium]|nr:DNA replication and repair protein RecF [bacterium]
MLKKLFLENFRNHKKATLEFGKCTLIIGENGAGKSNVIEALSLLSSCRSFREDDKKNLVNCDSDFARIVSGELEIFIQKTPRVLFKTKYKEVFRRQSEFVGIQKAVVFSPESISIICGTPKNRRRFIDMLISQKSIEYLRALVNYEKMRLERNALLERIQRGEGSEPELSFWDSGLVNEGSILLRHRKAVIEFLNSTVPSSYEKISGKRDKLEIEYVNTTTPEQFLADLGRKQRLEVARGKTLIGPHRDDLVFKLNSLDMSKFASRGEIRSGILALKVGELQYLKESTGNDEQSLPLLLLDDVFSEFDNIRRGHVLQLVGEYQSVITTTDKTFLPEEFLEDVKIIEL